MLTCHRPAFRDQDFGDIPIGDAVEFGKYFGRLHIHPTSPAPAGHPEVHVVFRGIDGELPSPPVSDIRLTLPQTPTPKTSSKTASAP